MKKSENQAKLLSQPTPQHSEFRVQATDNKTGIPYDAYVSSNFDSGNLTSLTVPDDKPNHVTPIL
jgi:hypothetical protein